MFSFFKKSQGHVKKKEYYFGEFHEGMARARGNNRACGYVNSNKELVISLTDNNGKIIFAGDKDINWENETVKRYEYAVREFLATYYFGGEDYKNGVALVIWTILPDGRYFEDDDGFGAENNDEVNIYCYIDKIGKVVIPFQGMTEKQIEEFREIAEDMISQKSY